MPDIVNYTELAEEISAIVTERVKNAREEGLRMYYDIGETLRRYEKNGTNITQAVKGLRHIMSETSLWFAVKMYDTYPKFESLYNVKDGLNTSVEKQKKLLGFRGKEKTPDECRRCPVHCK